MPHVEHLTATTYAAFVSPPGIAVVHFWADWDMRHLGVRLAIEAAIDRVGLPVRMAMFDTDRAGAFCNRIGVAVVPLVFSFRHGKNVGVQHGGRGADVIAAVLARIAAGGRFDRIPSVVPSD